MATSQHLPCTQQPQIDTLLSILFSNQKPTTTDQFPSCLLLFSSHQLIPLFAQQFCSDLSSLKPSSPYSSSSVVEQTGGKRPKARPRPADYTGRQCMSITPARNVPTAARPANWFEDQAVQYYALHRKAIGPVIQDICTALADILSFLLSRHRCNANTVTPLSCKMDLNTKVLISIRATHCRPIPCQCDSLENDSNQHTDPLKYQWLL